MELSLAIGKSAATLSKANRHSFLADAAIRALEKIVSQDPDSRPVSRLDIIMEQAALTASDPNSNQQVQAAKWITEQAFGTPPKELSDLEKQQIVLDMLLKAKSLIPDQDREAILRALTNRSQVSSELQALNEAHPDQIEE